MLADQYCQDLFTGQIALLAAYRADDADTVNPVIQDWFGICATYLDNVDRYYFTVGDSKTIGWQDHNLGCGGFGYQPYLSDHLTTATGRKWRDLRPRAAHGGYDAAAIAAALNADLALVTIGAPEHVLINIGANNVDVLPSQASFEANLGYILDACHAKWPSATMYVVRPWRRIFSANCDTLAGWIANVVAARSAWAFLGTDERIFLENGDDGATYTSDGVHPNAAGNALTAMQLQTALEY